MAKVLFFYERANRYWHYFGVSGFFLYMKAILGKETSYN